jgi:hypothetical protein
MPCHPVTMKAGDEMTMHVLIGETSFHGFNLLYSQRT